MDSALNNTISVLSILGNTLIGVAAWIVSYTGYPAEPAIILGTLMFIDFFVGIYSARRVGTDVTSRRMSRGIMSKVHVLFIPLVIALMAKGIGADLDGIVSYCISLLIITETYSIISNIYTARTGIQVPEWDAVSLILKKVKSLLEDIDKRE